MRFWLLLVLQPLAYVLVNGRPEYAQPGLLAGNDVLLSVVNLGASAVVCMMAVLGTLANRGIRSRIFSAIAVYGFILGVAAITNNQAQETLSMFVALMACVAVVTRGDAHNLLRDLRSLMRSLLLASVAAGALIPSFGLVPVGFSERHLFGIDSRLTGVAQSPAYMGTLALLLTVLELDSKKRTRWIFLGLSGVAVVWSQGRLQIVAMAMLAIYVTWARRRNSARSIFARRGILLISWGTALLPAVAAVGGRLPKSEDLQALTSDRTVVWGLIGRSWGEQWLIGRGPGIFGGSSSDIARANGTESFLNGHNQVLHSLAVGGVCLGLVSVVFLSVVLVAGLRALREDAVVVDGFVVVFLVFAVVSVPLQLNGLSWSLLPTLVLLAVVSGRGSLHQVTDEGRTVRGAVRPDVEASRALFGSVRAPVGGLGGVS